MQTVSDVIKDLYVQWKGAQPASVDLLPQSGSDRRYFRIHEADGGSIIATVGANTRENETFIYFSNHFQKKKLPTPRIYSVNDELTIYLQEDFGNVSLLYVMDVDLHPEFIFQMPCQRFGGIYTPVLSTSASKTYHQVVEPAPQVIFHSNIHHVEYAVQEFGHACLLLQEILYLFVLAMKRFVLIYPAWI